MNNKPPFFVSRLNPDSQHLYVMFTAAAGDEPGVNVLKNAGLMNHSTLLLRQPGSPQKGLYHGELSDYVKNFAQLRAWLAGYISQRHWKSVNFIGSSESGFAALIYGHYLKVDRVYAFAPVTKVSDVGRYRRKFALPDKWNLPKQHRDLGEFLNNGNGVTDYRIYYCEIFEPDIERVSTIRDCPQVSFYPQEGHEHSVLQLLNRSGMLKPLFDV